MNARTRDPERDWIDDLVTFATVVLTGAIFILALQPVPDTDPTGPTVVHGHTTYATTHIGGTP